MTQTTAKTTSLDPRGLTESYSRYDFKIAEARTDTPDLMRVFKDAELEAAYSDMRAGGNEIHTDLADVSVLSLAELD